MPRRQRLHHQRALEHAIVDEGHAQKGLERLLAGFAEVLEARVRLRVVDGDRAQLLGDQPDEPFVEPEAERADALGPQADGGGQDQVHAIRFEQIRGTDFGAETVGDEPHDAHQGLGGVDAGVGKRTEFVEREHFVDVVVRACDSKRHRGTPPDHPVRGVSTL